MTVNECEDNLVKLGVPEEVAVATLELLNMFGPYGVKLKVGSTLYVTVTSFHQGKFTIGTERALG